jgi:hypothetical protein
VHGLRDSQGVDFIPPEDHGWSIFLPGRSGRKLVSGWKLNTRIVTFYVNDIAIFKCRKIVCLDIFRLSVYLAETPDVSPDRIDRSFGAFYFELTVWLGANRVRPDALSSMAY